MNLHNSNKKKLDLCFCLNSIILKLQIPTNCRKRANFEHVKRGEKYVKMMVDDFGYTFSNALTLNNGDVRWRCSKKSSKEKCRVSAITSYDWIVRQNYQHTHPP